MLSSPGQKHIKTITQRV